MADFANLVELFDQHGVSFVSVTQHVVDPKAWLADVLGQIADIPQGRLAELLPWIGSNRICERPPGRKIRIGQLAHRFALQARADFRGIADGTQGCFGIRPAQGERHWTIEPDSGSVIVSSSESIFLTGATGSGEVFMR